MKIILLFFILFLPAFLFKNDKSSLSQNHPPTVKITAPRDRSSFSWNTSVRYKISVSDPEDGASKYGEISSKEVVLEVQYRKNLSKKQVDSIKRNIKIPPGLAVIESSNCFNCHQFNKKSTGPSFREIGMHYKHTEVNLELLAKRIKNGSSGNWGNQPMPSHLKLTDRETENIVRWIFTSVADTSISFYTGINGSFRIARKENSKTGVFILTANYTDQGTNGSHRMSGRDRVVIFGK